MIIDDVSINLAFCHMRFNYSLYYKSNSKIAYITTHQIIILLILMLTVLTSLVGAR